MRPYVVTLLLGLALGSGCRQEHERQTLEVTYIANEGFMIAMGGTKVLIDALSRSEYYADASDSMVVRLMDDTPPFDNVDYLLVTHSHPDHFNAEMVSLFLRKHPDVQFVADSGTCRKLVGDGIAARQCSGINLERGGQQTLRGDRAEVMAISLEHGGYRDVSNNGYIVRSNGYTIVHVGDAKLAFNEGYLRTIDWNSYNIDLLFIEYFDRSTPTHDIIKDLIKPKYVILMHIPPGEEETVRNEPEKVHPRTVVFGKENETRRFDVAADIASVR
jgi:L-ascorbate metabolism protein UlaG (beta-lactamase superfamily)